MATWKLQSPIGVIDCHKGRSFGEFVWKKPAPDKIFKTAYFSQDGYPLDRDVFVHIKDHWIPARGNEVYAQKIFYKDWEALGKPKTINGKKIGIVVKRPPKVASVNEASMVWNAKTEVKISKIHLHRFVSKDMKYIIPEPASIQLYVKLNEYLNKKGVVLLTKKVFIAKNSSREYYFAIIPLEKHLAYVEVLPEDLAKPFPKDALIPSDEVEEIQEFEDEGEDLI